MTPEEIAAAARIARMAPRLNETSVEEWFSENPDIAKRFLQTARAELAKLDGEQHEELTRDEAVDFVFVQLSDALNLESFEPCDETEMWDGDVIATLWKILRNAGVVDDNNAVATHARIADLEAELARVKSAADFLLSAAIEVNQRGAIQGSQWIKLGSAIISARTAMKGQTHD